MNEKLKEFAKKHNVKLWRVADKLGITDGNFSRKLRYQLSDEEEKKIYNLIIRLAQED